MLNFLKQSRKLLNDSVSTCLVIGNEACDLDSAVCALSLAYFYQQQPQAAQHIKEKRFLPVLNIPRRDYPLKTEVRYLLQRHSITEEHLTFRDELLEDFVLRSDCVLVDHHVSVLATRCVEVYDHRPLDSAVRLPQHCRLHLELVGSCATLIAEAILQRAGGVPDELHDTLSLLRSAIILDTVNFSESAARATAKDHAVCAALEELLSPRQTVQPRAAVFEELRKARADISALTPAQLLRKDLKIIANADNSIRVALPGFPLPVQRFIELPEAAAAVQQFAKEHACDIVLLMSMHVREEDGGNVERELGLINLKQADLCANILQQLLQSTDPPLDLQAYEGNFPMAAHFYVQNNIRATRKHVLPIVKQVLDNWASAA